MNNSKKNANPQNEKEIRDLIKRFSDAPELKSVAQTVDPKSLQKAAEGQDPEVIRAVLHQLLASEDGKRLAEKVKAAMKHG